LITDTAAVTVLDVAPRAVPFGHPLALTAPPVPLVTLDGEVACPPPADDEQLARARAAAMARAEGRTAAAGIDALIGRGFFMRTLLGLSNP
jgi:hypothetical protein